MPKSVRLRWMPESTIAIAGAFGAGFEADPSRGVIPDAAGQM
jgi:hypothetical protein